MSIKVTCQCRATYSVKDELAGKRVKCPKCQQPITIPAAEAVVSLSTRPSLSTTETPSAESAEPAAVAPPCPSCGQPMPEDKMVCTNCNYSRRLGRRLSSKLEVPPAKREKAAKPTKAKKAVSSEGKPKRQRNFFSVDGGKMLSGLLMMIGGALWLVLGIVLINRIFIYAPILCILGLISFVNGLFGKDGVW